MGVFLNPDQDYSTCMLYIPLPCFSIFLATMSAYFSTIFLFLSLYVPKVSNCTFLTFCFNYGLSVVSSLLIVATNIPCLFQTLFYLLDVSFFYLFLLECGQSKIFCFYSVLQVCIFGYICVCKRYWSQ